MVQQIRLFALSILTKGSIARIKFIKKYLGMFYISRYANKKFNKPYLFLGSYFPHFD